jgi:hypothetical protein
MRHKSWDAFTPSLFQASTNLAGKYVNREGSSIRQAASGRCKCAEFFVEYAEPDEPQCDLPGEIWKIATETLRVSNMGRTQKRKGKQWQLIQRPMPTNGPYVMVLVNKRLHKVIYEAFHGPVPDGYLVDHIDINTSNNRLDNLRILDASNSNRNRKSWKRVKNIH